MTEFSNAKVLVVGDVMLDRYWNGATQRISPEAPVPVVKINTTYERLGGSGNVAANIAALGAKANLLALTGDDVASDSIVRLSDELGIECNFVRDTALETPIKLRVISQQQQLIRLDFENTLTSTEKLAELTKTFESLISQSDVLVLSDYGKGTVDDPQELIQRANELACKVIVDPKGKRFDKYKSAYLITPNFKEFEDVVGDCPDEKTIELKGKALIEELKLHALLVTRGDKGMSLIRRAEDMLTLTADSQEVYDVTGAGDTVCGVCAVAMAAGADLELAIDLANRAAGIVVKKFGTATVSTEELASALEPISNKVLSQDGVGILNSQRSQGARLVFTNGCFDILHAGHVDYLNRAKSLGDLLIVAVNSDDSVKGLKGSDRPINALSNRMAVLAGLEAVDFLIAFDSPTPLELIENIKPDILVKGGDYALEDIVGAEQVKASGGVVTVLPFVEGLSTTKILEKVQSAQQKGSA